MKLDRIRQLADFMRENGIAELEVGSLFSRLRISLGSVIRGVEDQPTSLNTEIQTAKETETELAEEELKEVVAPMVGTFYRAPAPGEEPFVREGQRVNKGQVLCIVEAMKLMNEIVSEFSGTVVKILVENGQPVEYGQKMFLIKPD